MTLAIFLIALFLLGCTSRPQYQPPAATTLEPTTSAPAVTTSTFTTPTPSLTQTPPSQSNFCNQRFLEDDLDYCTRLNLGKDRQDVGEYFWNDKHLTCNANRYAKSDAEWKVFLVYLKKNCENKPTPAPTATLCEIGRSTNVAIKLEGEEASIISEEASGTYPQKEARSDTSGGYVMMFSGKSPNEKTATKLSVVSGKYDVSVTYLMSADSAPAIIQINDADVANLSQNKGCVNANGLVSTKLGTHALSENSTITISSSGTDPSGTGAWFGIDYIELIPTN